MKNLKLHSCYALASAAVVGIAACAGGTDGSSRFAAPTSPANDVVVSVAQTGELCKVGPVGTYNFTLVFGGSSYGTDVKATSPVAINVTDPAQPACTTVFTRSAYPGGSSDPAATIQITESASLTTGLQGISASGGAAPAVIDAANRRVTIAVNAFHGATTTFTNVAIGGCTFTQGWYKNHTDQWPAGFSPNTVFDGWLSWIDLYNTPPKGGNAYIQLAHQYMTALMNVANGAAVPANVQTALNTAAAYFAGGGAGTGGATDITGVAAILDAYNNGLTGPGHCD
ncbi:MAG TPA: hypothetical protein VFS59_06995 [Gemmatimonadaceae bacterium]|nr:hypothetical protein [Gemmatimonadaceae bacterium]